MDDLISRQAAIDALAEYIHNVDKVMGTGHLTEDDCKDAAASVFEELPSAQPEIIKCKDCKHQEKFFHEDRRRKDGGHYIYGCELADGYSHVCLDDDFCSRGERRT